MAQRGRKSRAALELIGRQWEGHHPQPASDPPDPPGHLGEPERRIWTDVFGDYSLATDASIAVLTTALEAHQRARECREAILRHGGCGPRWPEQATSAVERRARRPAGVAGWHPGAGT